VLRRQGFDAVGGHCTTWFEKAHRTVLREVLYRYHPWFGRQVCVNGMVDKAVMSLCATRLMDRKQIDGWRFQHGCSTGRHALTPSFWQLGHLSA
jgi:hypothetical protein